MKTKSDIITSLRCAMFATSDSMDEAWRGFIRAWSMLDDKDKSGILTAMCVWNNTVAQALEELTSG